MAKKRTKVFRSDRLRILESEYPGNQDDFAALVDLDQSQMSRYLTGKSEPSPELIRRMAAQYKVTTDWLLGLTTDRHLKISMDDLDAKERAIIRAYRAAPDAE